MLAAVFISPCTPSFNVFLAHSFSRFTVPLLAPSVVVLLIIAFFPFSFTCYSKRYFYLFNRNQNEARNRGGIKALCELLKNAPDEKVSLLFDLVSFQKRTIAVCTCTS